MRGPTFFWVSLSSIQLQPFTAPLPPVVPHWFRLNCLQLLGKKIICLCVSQRSKQQEGVNISEQKFGAGFLTHSVPLSQVDNHTLLEIYRLLPNIFREVCFSRKRPTLLVVVWSLVIVMSHASAVPCSNPEPNPAATILSNITSSLVSIVYKLNNQLISQLLSILFLLMQKQCLPQIYNFIKKYYAFIV